jgi:dihydroxyacetone kinase-like protein
MPEHASGLHRHLIEAVTGALISHSEELTELDQAIGDGDHGVNMRRGAEAVLEQADELAGRPWPEMLRGIGTTLVMKVGGASGPLYGTLLLNLGKALPPSPTRAELSASLERAIAATKARGRSDVGQKTMLDVLVPAQRGLAEGLDSDSLKRVSTEARLATVPMQALRGRAAFLGERSIGHVDPGARSSELMIHAVIDALGA